MMIEVYEGLNHEYISMINMAIGYCRYKYLNITINTFVNLNLQNSRYKTLIISQKFRQSICIPLLLNLQSQPNKINILSMN